MASLSHSLVTSRGNLVSGGSVSDLIRSSSNGLSGVPLKSLGRTRFGIKTKDLRVFSKLGKVKKHDYPWPDNADPNVKGGVLSHLSHFKLLKEKQKPVTLDFEKPLMDLRKKIIDVQKMANETDLDFSDQIILLETKYQQALKDLYTHLTPIQRVNIARHPNRPTFLDHVLNITERFVELHGDRSGYDDPAIVTGLGTINDKNYMFIGHQKGRNTKENIQRNFGMPTPQGYRKALRMMYYADHHGFPIVTFIDTPGAYADLKSEELGQGEAIAHNLRTMFGLKVPIISIVIGEGGSGGALAIGCSNIMLMLENSVFYVASPEACAAILWKSAKAAPKAAEKLRITAGELLKLQIADGIIPEPLGGAHADPHWTSQQIKTAILDSMEELNKMDTEKLLEHRMLKFRKLGGFQEGIPVDPIKKVNMKKKEEPIIKPGMSPEELEGEVKELKQKILKAKESSSEHPESGLNEMIKKLKIEVDYELSEAMKALGLTDRSVALQQDFEKSRNSKDHATILALNEQIENLKNEFKQNLHTAPNYKSLKYKIDMLSELSRAKDLSEKNGKIGSLKQEINKKFEEILDRPDLKGKIESIRKEIEGSEVESATDLDQDLKDNILKLKEEIEMEFSNILKQLDLHIEPPTLSAIKNKADELNQQTMEVIEDMINSSDLKDQIEQLKVERAKAGQNPSLETKNKIEGLEQNIRQALVDAMDSSVLKKKYERLMSEFSEAVNSSETSQVNFETNSSFS
ncbi:acetyl-coenzyme A carboxylase carboxyl transferase subunit alpha, chloroplastic-like [Impatiens glandulifera]|uniref:acetyl-coenzyme A carboxylase carboxyl transferase subunit alpha, chloroplastic-like n=1 Tax=Impatiens glandulifera TaxID=253017 RepID=UPI001FB12A49|nr:acetyl-coenzyme A carboxylase carboxyl transferase subunit alpha, chloroplastic-like [Impatiens glandulifera]